MYKKFILFLAITFFNLPLKADTEFLGNEKIGNLLLSPDNNSFSFNDGFSSEIIAIISNETCDNNNDGERLRGEANTSLTWKKDTIANLLVYYHFEEYGNRDSDGNYRGLFGYKYEGFNPIIFEESNGNIKKKGFLQSKNNEPAFEKYKLFNAIDNRKALYCAWGRGAIIYSFDSQPDCDLCEQLKEQYKF